MELEFTPRKDLAAYEWDFRKEDWLRPEIDRELLKKLSERSTWRGVCRLAVHGGLLLASAAAAVAVGLSFGWGWAIPLLYVYYFFYGFLTALGHELQHKTVLGRKLDGLNEAIFFVVQVLTWNSPTHARIGHKLHHRYTMVRGLDPETAWPEVFTTKWTRGVVFDLVSRLLVVGAVYELGKSVCLQAKRALGVEDDVMAKHCNEREVRRIRIESLAILLVHVAVAVAAVLLRLWPLLAFVTLAWQIGMGIESFWHHTEHIARAYNVKDLRLCTRSVRVSGFVRLIYWGLGDHVDHHWFPIVPSWQLPKLHQALASQLAEPRGKAGCWAEMFAIAREKDVRPENEFVPVKLQP